MWILIMVLYVVLALCGHFLLCHFLLRGGIFSKFVISFLFVGIMLVVHFLMLFGLDGRFLGVIFIYGFLSELYIFLFSMISSSISVSLLLMLENKNCTSRDINETYSSEGMVLRRLDKMCYAGLLIKVDSFYAVTSKGKILLKIYYCLRKHFLHSSVPS